jgi:hypothetical protein
MAAEAEAAREARAKVFKSRDPQITGKCMSWSLKKVKLIGCSSI